MYATWFKTIEVSVGRHHPLSLKPIRILILRPSQLSFTTDPFSCLIPRLQISPDYNEYDISVSPSCHLVSEMSFTIHSAFISGTLKMHKKPKLNEKLNKYCLPQNPFYEVLLDLFQPCMWLKIWTGFGHFMYSCSYFPDIWRSTNTLLKLACLDKVSHLKR